jgi:hypothetical protein
MLAVWAVDILLDRAYSHFQQTYTKDFATSTSRRAYRKNR